MKEKGIALSYNHEEKRLTVCKDGRPLGGFCGNIATEMMKKIAYNNAKVEVKDGNVQVGVQ